MPDALDDATLADIRAMVGAVNENTLVLPGRHGGPLSFAPGELFCYDVTWISGESIHGRCWYDPHGFGLQPIAQGRPSPERPFERYIVEYGDRRRAHFPDHVVWKVNNAPRKRNAQNRMFDPPDTTLPMCPDTLESPIMDGVKSRKEPTSEYLSGVVRFMVYRPAEVTGW